MVIRILPLHVFEISAEERFAGVTFNEIQHTDSGADNNGCLP